MRSRGEEVSLMTHFLWVFFYIVQYRAILWGFNLATCQAIPWFTPWRTPLVQGAVQQPSRLCSIQAHGRSCFQATCWYWLRSTLADGLPNCSLLLSIFVK